MVDAQRGPAEGWYPDPAGGGGHRWWDGTTWTAHVHPAAAPEPAYQQAPSYQPVNQPAYQQAPSYQPVNQPAYQQTPSYAPAYAPAPGPQQYGAYQPWTATPVPQPTPRNRAATVALTLSLVMVVAGVLSGYYVGSLLPAIIAARALAKAKELQQQGLPPVGRARAIVAIVVSAALFVLVVVLRVTAATP